ncbi:HAD family hydrolase [Coraliomargarita sinensis]|uniref:phosphoglycolate phosphatase n=1 Tax=Coraliomargarita sinensis TaxID=2174842 RepID=A0A317ZKD2_9BACT|nr:HAD family hydrolase [Coraliomargarita sinensis]PXA03811.1 HAD family hydrolase [Coraliomargarita sinensis]
MNRPLPKAVLWDMDGTLIDQTAPIIQCYTEVITALGHTAPDTDVIRRSLGGPMASTMGLFVENERMEEACLAFRKRFPEIMLDGLIILPGALELIDFFAGKECPQAIFTNKHGETARAVSKHCGFSRKIKVCIGNTDTEWAKPDPKLTNYVLEQIKAQSEGAILIGDSPTDAETARNANLIFYGVSTGAHSVEELRAGGAEMACQSLEDLLHRFNA